MSPSLIAGMKTCAQVLLRATRPSTEGPKCQLPVYDVTGRTKCVFRKCHYRDMITKSWYAASRTLELTDECTLATRGHQFALV